MGYGAILLIMKAFILAAGLGTRLRPLTYRLPKALLPVAGKPAIFHIINHLKSAGVKEVIINRHHLPNKFDTILGNGSRFKIKIRYSNEKKLLDTGGGLKKVEYFLKYKTFIMYNCDVMTDIDLEEMIKFHKKNKNLVTLLASNKHRPKHLFVDRDGKVRSIGADIEKKNYAFCGIHVIEPFIFEHIPKGKPISIISTYKTLIGKGVPIHIFPLGKAFWQEIGSMESYEEINKKSYKF